MSVYPFLRYPRSRKAGSAVSRWILALTLFGRIASSVPPDSLGLFQIEGSGEGVNRFSHQAAASRLRPDTVARRMGAGMGLLGANPEDPGVGLQNDIPLLLDRRRVYPVFRVEEFSRS